MRVLSKFSNTCNDLYNFLRNRCFVTTELNTENANKHRRNRNRERDYLIRHENLLFHSKSNKDNQRYQYSINFCTPAKVRNLCLIQRTGSHGWKLSICGQHNKDFDD